MVTMAHRIRRAVQKLGVDLQRYPGNDPAYRVVRILQSNAIDFVIDVGANSGGYAVGLRKHGYDRRIASFEPLPEPFTLLSRRASSDSRWEVYQQAVGAEPGEIEINIAGNAGASSSALPMLQRHRDAAPDSAYVGQITAAVGTLDDWIAGQAELGERVFIKLDVQGFEAEVLAGARGILESDLLAGIQMEISFVPLYEGAMDWREAFCRADEYGLRLFALEPGFSDKETGQMLQADGIFVR